LRSIGFFYIFVRANKINYDYHPTRIPAGGSQLRQFLSGSGTLFRDPAVVEHADQVFGGRIGRGAARSQQETGHSDRGGRGGAAEIRETLRAYDHIREAVAELKGETSGRLRLGVIPTIAPYLLHKFIPDFVRDYPKVELEIAEMVTADIVDALRRDRIDAALVAGGTCGEGIQEHELFDDRFHLYVSRENPLFERTNVRIEDIDLKELVLLSPGHCMRDQIIELCQAKREVPSHYTFESGSLDTLMRIVDYTHCVTITPEMAVEYIPAEHRCQVKTLAKGATSRKIAVAVRRTYVKSSIIKALIDTILSKVSRQ